jgi:esterase
MQLFFRKLGSGPPLIILHGLYGSSDNWISIARALSDSFEVIIPDLRNHGKSPWSDHHDYPSMVEDILQLIDLLGYNKVHLLGHSMGGKVAMFFANDYPDRMASLSVVDISPFAYHDIREEKHLSVHKEIINAMQELDLDSIATREEADDRLAASMTDKALRGFLLKNLVRMPDDKFQWKLNLAVISNHLLETLDGLPTDQSSLTGFPVLFIKGGESPYIRKEDYPGIKKIFPQAEIVEIPGAGHWLHAENPSLFLKTVRHFLNG